MSERIIENVESQVIESTLTVLYEAPFWVGVYERTANGRYEVCRIIFGAEPSSQEVWLYLLKNWYRLRFSSSTENISKPLTYKNPKRQQRAIKRLTQAGAIGTKAQQALKQQHEERKAESQERNKIMRMAEKEFKYKLHKEKQQKRHRGK